MRAGLKVTLVTCDKCGDEQLWSQETVTDICESCNSYLVRKTISPEDLTKIKKVANGDSAIVFSDYEVYSLLPNDLRKIRVTQRAEKKKRLAARGPSYKAVGHRKAKLRFGF